MFGIFCCSGGGIRSSAFNLGALQRLSESGHLAGADYLAAVSGGSYIAAAFSMFNRYVDGLATLTPKDPEAYQAMGERMARHGYLRPAPQAT